MFDIIENSNLVVREQIKFPISKKKRIRKKWAKDEKNWRLRPDRNIYVLESASVNRLWMRPARQDELESPSLRLVAHPIVARELRKTLRTPHV